MEIHKLKLKKQDEFKKWESNAVLTREILCLTYNLWRGKSNPQLSPQDFIKLSFDKINQAIEERTDEEILSKFPKNFKDIVNGK